MDGGYRLCGRYKLDLDVAQLEIRQRLQPLQPRHMRHLTLHAAAPWYL